MAPPRGAIPVGPQRIYVGNAAAATSVSSNQSVPGSGAAPRPPTAPAGPLYPSSVDRSAMGQAQPQTGGHGGGRESDGWISQEVLPGIELRVRPGMRAMLQPVGTPEVPAFLLTVGRAIGVRPSADAHLAGLGKVEYAYAGLLPIAALLAKPIGKAVKRALDKAGQKSAPAAIPPASTSPTPASPQAKSSGTPRRPGQLLDDIEDALSAAEELQRGDQVEIGGEFYTCAGFDAIGAILVDSDGKRVEV